MIKTAMFPALIIALTFGPVLIVPTSLPVLGDAVAAIAQEDPPEQPPPGEEVPEDMTRADESPLDEFDPREARWQVWIGPLLLGAFVVFLVLMIFRFSIRGGKKDDSPP